MLTVIFTTLLMLGSASAAGPTTDTQTLIGPPTVEQHEEDSHDLIGPPPADVEERGE